MVTILITQVPALFAAYGDQLIADLIRGQQRNAQQTKAQPAPVVDAGMAARLAEFERAAAQSRHEAESLRAELDRQRSAAAAAGESRTSAVADLERQLEAARRAVETSTNSTAATTAASERRLADQIARTEQLAQQLAAAQAARESTPLPVTSSGDSRTGVDARPDSSDQTRRAPVAQGRGVQVAQGAGVAAAGLAAGALLYGLLPNRAAVVPPAPVVVDPSIAALRQERDDARARVAVLEGQAAAGAAAVAAARADLAARITAFDAAQRDTRNQLGLSAMQRDTFKRNLEVKAADLARARARVTALEAEVRQVQAAAAASRENVLNVSAQAISAATNGADAYVAAAQRERDVARALLAQAIDVRREVTEQRDGAVRANEFLLAEYERTVQQHAALETQVADADGSATVAKAETVIARMARDAAQRERDEALGREPLVLRAAELALERVTADQAAAHQRVVDALRAERDEAQAAAADAIDHRDGFSGLVDILGIRQEGLIAELAERKSQLDALSAEVARRETRNTKLEAAVKDAREQVAFLTEQLAIVGNQRRAAQGLRPQSAAGEAKISKRVNVAALREALRVAHAQIDQRAREIAALNRTVNSLRSAAPCAGAGASPDIAGLMTQIATLTARNTELQAQVVELERIIGGDAGAILAADDAASATLAGTVAEANDTMAQLEAFLA